MYSISDAVVSAFALVTMIFVIYLTRPAFKKHYMNVFSYLILILIVLALAGK